MSRKWLLVVALAGCGAPRAVSNAQQPVVHVDGLSRDAEPYVHPEQSPTASAPPPDFDSGRYLDDSAYLDGVMRQLAAFDEQRLPVKVADLAAQLPEVANALGERWHESETLYRWVQAEILDERLVLFVENGSSAHVGWLSIFDEASGKLLATTTVAGGIRVASRDAVGDGAQELFVYTNNSRTTGAYDIGLSMFRVLGTGQLQGVLTERFQVFELHGGVCLFRRPVFPSKGRLDIETYIAAPGCPYSRPVPPSFRPGDRQRYSWDGQGLVAVQLERGLRFRKELLGGQ